MTLVPTTLQHTRNIGISAHVDAGKTTLTERVLFYTGRIHRMGEVHDGEAVMDGDNAEQKHGITIRSAATRVDWGGHAITIIDTPGHADFAVEVERSLRVLDGAVFVFSAVEGVQAQSLAVDRQMRRHGVPRIAFINKMDRVGADAVAVVRDIRAKLGVNALAVQLPIGSEAAFAGVIDLVQMRALRFTGAHGDAVEVEAIPAQLRARAVEARTELIDALSLDDDTLLTAALSGDVTAACLRAAIRRATLSHRAVPVLCGSAYRNVGVQPLLDAVIAYLPHPGEVEVSATAAESDETIALTADPDASPCAFVFKVEASSFGQLAFVRVYQGTLERGATVWCARVGARPRAVRLSRLVRLHPGTHSAIDSASAGEIVGVFGGAFDSGDTLCGADPATGRSLGWRLAGFEVPEPVVSRTVEVERKADLGKLAKVMARFAREDPSLRVGRDQESGRTLISGTGMLQLEILAERLADDHGLAVRLGDPQVAYRETVTAAVEFDYLHSKQDGGRGQYAGVVGRLRPLESIDADDPSDGASYRFVDDVRGGAIPKPFLAACDRGAREALEVGPLVGAPVVGVEVEIVDGRTHDKDSSELAFHVATRDAVREALVRAQPRLLEPIMRLEVEGPRRCYGALQGSVVRRRGTIVGSELDGERVTLFAQVPLAETFDYAVELGSLCHGEGCHSMSLAGYARVPSHVEAKLVERKRSVG